MSIEKSYFVACSDLKARCSTRDQEERVTPIRTAALTIGHSPAKRLMVFFGSSRIACQREVLYI